MSNRIELEVGLLNDGKVQLAIKENGTVLGFVLMDELEVSKHIATMAEMRAKMAEPVAPELSPGSRVETVSEPAWKIEGEAGDVADPVVLSLRHPGTGWTAFLLGHVRARQIATALLDRLPRIH